MCLFNCVVKGSDKASLINRINNLVDVIYYNQTSNIRIRGRNTNNRVYTINDFPILKKLKNNESKSFRWRADGYVKAGQSMERKAVCFESLECGFSHSWCGLHIEVCVGFSSPRRFFETCRILGQRHE